MNQNTYSANGGTYITNGLHQLCSYIKYVQQKLPIGAMSLVELGTQSAVPSLIFSNYFLRVVSVADFVNATDEEKLFVAAIKDTRNIFKLKHSVDDFFASYVSSVNHKLSIDVVYINESNDPGKLKYYIDCAMQLPKVRFVCGHGYFPENYKTVVKAIDEKFGRPDKVFDDTSWLIQK